MHNRAILLLSLALALFPLATGAQSLGPASPEQVGMSSQRLAKITTVFKKEIDEGRIPGAVVAVARKGKLVYYESFGARDKATGAPMTKDSIFRIYSMTKPLVSVAAMLLVEDGSIQLTDPVSKFLPAFAKTPVSIANRNEIGNVVYETVPQARPMTVHEIGRAHV